MRILLPIVLVSAGGLAACGIQTKTESNRSEVTATSDNAEIATEVTSNSEGTHFFLDLPTEMREADPLPPIEVIPPVERQKFSLICYYYSTNENGDNVADQTKPGIIMPYPLAKIDFTLTSSDGETYNETHEFRCQGVAMVIVNDLSMASSYKLSADLYNHKGLRYQGGVKFAPADQKKVKMVMRRFVEPRVDVNVDIVFEPVPQPSYCLVSYDCTDEYAPAICSATWTMSDFEIASAMLLNHKGYNQCDARSKLMREACELQEKYPHGILGKVRCEMLPDSDGGGDEGGSDEGGSDAGDTTGGDSDGDGGTTGDGGSDSGETGGGSDESGSGTGEKADDNDDQTNQDDGGNSDDSANNDTPPDVDGSKVDTAAK